MLKEKIRTVFLPFLLLAVSFLIVYSFLNWLLVIKTGVLPLHEDITHIWLPYCLPYIPVLIWLRPRVKIFNYKKSDQSFGLLMLAGMAIAAPCIVAQFYIDSAAGQLTVLSGIQDINNLPPTKYYTVGNYFIDKKNRGLKFSSDVSGKSGQTLNLHIYIACPMYARDSAAGITGRANPEQPSLPSIEPVKIDPVRPRGLLFILDGRAVDSLEVVKLSKDSVVSVNILNGKAATALYGVSGEHGVVVVESKRPPPPMRLVPVPAAWYCINYRNQISNNLSAAETKVKENAFYDDCIQKFMALRVYDFEYLVRTGNNQTFDGYKKATAKVALPGNQKKQPILEPVSTAYKDRNGNKLAWIFGALAIGAAILFLLLLPLKVDDQKLKSWQTGRHSEPISLKEGLQYFIPRPGFYSTPILLDLNILVYLLLVFAGAGFWAFPTEDLLKWGANYGPYTRQGQWWRLLTSTFLHGGLAHLAANMTGLLFAGIFLEPVIGRKSILLAYLGSGIAGSLASIWWYTAVLSAGASGAVFGLYGVFLALLLYNIFPPRLNRTFLVTTIIFIVFNLAGGIWGGIDNAAHVGGLITGFVTGLYLAGSIRRQRESGALD